MTIITLFASIIVHILRRWLILFVKNGIFHKSNCANNKRWNMSNFLNEAKAMQEELSRIRREIHRKPEVGMDLPLTTAFVMEQLENTGSKRKESSIVVFLP